MHSAAAALTLATIIAVIGLAATPAAAAPKPEAEKGPPAPAVPKFEVDNSKRAFKLPQRLPCEAKYAFGSTGFIWITNNLKTTIPQQSRVTVIWKIGDKSYKSVEILNGYLVPGKKIQALPFLWQPQKPASCITATVEPPAT
jgi:hypothetical protein